VKRFTTAFCIGMLMFAIANIVASIIRSDDIDEPDCHSRWGFPLLISETNLACEEPNPYFSYTAFWTDAGVAIIASCLIASVYVRIRRNATIQRI
jgi:hypothetical protein